MFATAQVRVFWSMELCFFILTISINFERTDIYFISHISCSIVLFFAIVLVLGDPLLLCKFQCTFCNDQIAERKIFCRFFFEVVFEAVWERKFVTCNTRSEICRFISLPTYCQLLQMKKRGFSEIKLKRTETNKIRLWKQLRDYDSRKKLIRQQIDINERQFEFMRRCQTTDTIFILKQLQEKKLAKSEDLYFRFIHFQKAFD